MTDLAVSCAVEGCGKVVCGIGLCNTHYMRQYRSRTEHSNDRLRYFATRQAAKWVRNNHPEVWQSFMDAARQKIENPAAVGSGNRFKQAS